MRNQPIDQSLRAVTENSRLQGIDISGLVINLILLDDVLGSLFSKVRNDSKMRRPLRQLPRPVYIVFLVSVFH